MSHVKKERKQVHSFSAFDNELKKEIRVAQCVVWNYSNVSLTKIPLFFYFLRRSRILFFSEELQSFKLFSTSAAPVFCFFSEELRCFKLSIIWILILSPTSSKLILVEDMSFI